MKTLYHHFLNHIDVLPPDFLRMIDEGEERERVVCDYVGAMTDRFALATYEEIYIPKSWHGWLTRGQKERLGYICIILRKS